MWPGPVDLLTSGAEQDQRSTIDLGQQAAQFSLFALRE
jgi:hypothetical protein